MKKAVFILVGFLLFASVLHAQKLTIAVSSTKVATGEAFQLQFSLSGQANNFKLPPMSELTILEGPYTQSFSETDLNTGKSVQQSSVTYIVAAKKEGKLNIGPATALSNGKPIQSNVVTMEVSKGANTLNQGTQNPGAVPNPTKPTSKEIGDNLFAKLEVSNTKPYMGEVIEVTFKVYTRIEILWPNVSQFPKFEDFFKQDIKTPEKVNPGSETINGITYRVGSIRKCFLMPRHAGKATIDPFELECIYIKKRKPRDRYEQLMGTNYDEVTYLIKSLPVTIDVQALPEEGKPAGFSGAVGHYTYKAEMTKENVKSNDAVNLTFSLSGSGNIKLIEPTKVNFPEDFETYDVKTGETINITGNGINGTKTFDYMFIPRHEGDYTIEAVPFSYFDPSKKEYVTIPVPEFKLHVEKGENSSAVVSNGTVVKDDLKVLGNDIRYIKTSTELRDGTNYFYGSALFYTLLCTPLLCFLSFIFIRRKNIEENKDGVAVKSRKARKMAKKRLSVAEQHLNSGNKELFYIEIFKALYGYISDKLNIPVAELSKEHIAQTLKSKNVSEATVEKLISTLDNCEYARYAPNAVSGDLSGIYNSTVELIAKTEDEIV